MKFSASRMEGVSLIEVVLTLAIVAIAAGMAVPSYDQVRQKRHVTGIAEDLASFLSDIHSSAIKHNDRLTVSLAHAGAADWCVGAVLGETACDCTVRDASNPAYCSIDGASRILANEKFTAAEMTTHSADTTFTIEPVRGLMINADLGTQHFYNLMSTSGVYGLRVNVLPTGYVRVCNFDSNHRVPGYTDCGA